jgi:hypothetical protein
MEKLLTKGVGDDWIVEIGINIYGEKSFEIWNKEEFVNINKITN